jgi:hypothetical protein
MSMAKAELVAVTVTVARETTRKRVPAWRISCLGVTSKPSGLIAGSPSAPVTAIQFQFLVSALQYRSILGEDRLSMVVDSPASGIFRLRKPIPLTTWPLWTVAPGSNTHRIVRTGQNLKHRASSDRIICQLSECCPSCPLAGMFSRYFLS